MASIRKLSEDENINIDWSLAQLIRDTSRNGLQADIAITSIRTGGITIISDNEEIRNPKELTVQMQAYFGRENLEIVPLMDSQAKDLGVRQPAFAVRLKSN